MKEVLFEQAKKWVLEAREELISKLNDDIIVENKTSRKDLVTTMDRHIENFLKDKILTKYPEHSFFGEEGVYDIDFSGYVWILDPIDGTTNFVKRKQDYAISLGLYHAGVGILGLVCDVERGVLYSALQGSGAYMNEKKIEKINDNESYEDNIIVCDFKELQTLTRLAPAIENSLGHRRMGAACLEMIEVATGRASIFLHMLLSPWDFAAARVICEEAGCVVTRLDGTTINPFEKGSLVVGSKTGHKNFIKDVTL